MKKYLLAFLLLANLPAHAITWETPQFVGDCYQWDIMRDAVRRVAYVMGLPQEAVKRTVVYCDPWTKNPSTGWTFQYLGFGVVDCPYEYWTWYVGCINGTASGYSPPGWIAVLQMHPNVTNFMVDGAIRRGLSLGSRTREEIVCYYSLEHLVRVTIHEYLHVWKGMRHGAAMSEADAYWWGRYAALYGDWVVSANWAECQDWAECQQPRKRSLDAPISEELKP